ncbi:hypothetical protein [Deinococcus altitudinis]|uniref:hypothetical protein n=1 Tax=Deinococcus altitudinis TaxID=468914 RepID=UPI0038917241
MKRRQIVAACLLRSLSKRMWLVLLPALAVGVLAYMALGSAAPCLLAFLLVALSVTSGVLRSSYVRHVHEFPTTGYGTLLPPLITEE